MQIDVWFEFASTYSYPAVARINALAASQDVTVCWRPFLLGPIFKSQAWTDSPFNLYPVKGDYMWHDLERTCLNLNIPYSKPSVFPRNGLLAARVACHYSTEEWVGKFILAIFAANFVHDQDIASVDVVSACLAELGVDATRAIEGATSNAGKARLAEQTDQAIALGIFGAPTFAVDRELFWGNDRLEEALEWCRTHAA